MAFCGNCGAKVDDGVKFCPSCGTAIDAADIEQNAEGSESQTVACSEKSRFTCG